MYVAFVVLLINLMVLGLLFCGFWNLQFLKIGLFVLLAKTLIDTILFFCGYSLFKKKKIVLYNLVLQAVYPFYILVTTILALTYTGKWKGRGLKNKSV
jgi:hypothetical protein